MLTDAQAVTFKAAVLAETDPTAVALRTAGSTGDLAAWYNQDSAFVVWRSTTSTSVISNNITWANFTPADAADGTALFTNRAYVCFGKQQNLQNLLIASPNSVMATGFPTIRTGLQDCLTGLPSGASGATQAAGWLSVKAAIVRNARRGEKVFATGTGTALNPGDLIWEGLISNDDVVKALFN